MGVNEAGEGEGETLSFTTISPEVPTVNTLEEEKIDEINFLLKGEIEDHGREGLEVFEVGLEWTSTSGLYGNPNKEETFSYTDDQFETEVRLRPETMYYFRAKAQNEDGWGYGEERSFQTGFSESGIIRIRWNNKEREIEIEPEGRFKVNP